MKKSLRHAYALCDTNICLMLFEKSHENDLQKQINGKIKLDYDQDFAYLFNNSNRTLDLPRRLNRAGVLEDEETRRIEKLLNL